MDGTIIKFGDIFRYREYEYVFLAQSNDTIFAAKIINNEIVNKIQELSAKREASMSKLKRHALYSLVMLNTKDFEGKAVHFYGTDSPEHQSVTSFDIIGDLEKEDVLSIKAEIESGESIVPLRLIEIVKQLNIS